MAENTTKAGGDSAVMEDYQNNFMKKVHLIGQGSMIIAAMLSFLPIAYFYFVKGWQASGSAYTTVIIAIVAYGFSMWLTEPVSYYPILGSAGTYMSYLAGNVGNMRAPVAMAIQSSLGEEVTSPRGNIATIISIAMSVYVNLLILIGIVAGGEAILNILPKTIINAFAYTLPSLYGSMLVMRIMAKPKKALLYLPFTVVIYFVTMYIPAFTTYSLAICVVGTILAAYVLYKTKEGKTA
ncbi:MAG: hypothetical protein VB078_11985 [Clostridiaceae bacterium]|nr:hypothetical protein [Clostridiaceae bacterium]